MEDRMYAKLRGRIVEKYGSQSAFADAIGLSKNITNKKLNGKVGISSDDIKRWSSLLDIDRDEIGLYFFN